MKHFFGDVCGASFVRESHDGKPLLSSEITLRTTEGPIEFASSAFLLRFLAKRLGEIADEVDALAARTTFAQRAPQ